MSDAILDYRLGWRWLLPVKAGERIVQVGFSGREERFLRHALPDLNWRDDPNTADVWVVNATTSTPDACLKNGQRTVCVLAGRAQGAVWRTMLRARFPVVHEYGLLPAGYPRVVVPLSIRQHAVQALSLHRPGRLVARFGVSLARWLARVGHYFLLRGQVLLIGTHQNKPVPYGAGQAGLEGNQEYALYLGTPDDNRKTVALPLGNEAPDLIVKVGASSKARAALENEALALQAFSGTPVARQIPQFYKLAASDESLALHQEYRSRKRVGSLILAKHVVAFLAKLALLDAECKPLGEVLDNLPALTQQENIPKVARSSQMLLERLGVLAESGLTVWRHRTHGDFAPWNCSWTDRGLFVYDWEASRAQGLALEDAFYYVTAPALLVQRKASAEKVVGRALRLANEVARKVGKELNPRIYLALWLLARPDKSGLYGEMIVFLAQSWR